MALFKRRLRSVKDSWNEMAAVVMEMQETLEAWAARLAIAMSRKQDTLTAGCGIAIENGVISAVGTGGGYEVILDQVCTTAAKLNLVLAEPMRDVSVMVLYTKDMDRGSAANVVYAYQGSTIVGRLSIAAGTVTATKQACQLRVFSDNGVWRNWYLAPTVSGTTAAYNTNTVYSDIAVRGGITKVTSTQVIPVGARLMLYGVPMGEG